MAVEIKLKTKELAAKLDDAGTWTYAASEWHRLYRQYVPYAEGMLYNTIRITGSKGHAEITHTVPYAHYMYEGVIYGPSVPIMQGGVPTGYFTPVDIKHNTGRPITYSKLYSGKATRHWDEAAMATQLPLLEESVGKFIKAKL